MNFGKAKFKNQTDEKKKTTFNDVAGADEEKEELEEIDTKMNLPENATNAMLLTELSNRQAELEEQLLGWYEEMEELTQ